MGKVPISQLKKTQELPSRIGTGKHNSRDRWGSRHDDYHPVDGVSPWKRVKRILKASVGKKFDVVFHEYCQEVPDYQQKFFLKEFEENLRGYNWNRYYVDEDGLIQEHEPENKYKGPYTFYSIDCVIERRHKITGKKESNYYWHDKTYNPNDYEGVIVQGWTKQFDSKNDPEFKRLKAEKQMVKDKEWEAKHAAKQISEEDYRKILRAKELKEKAEDLVKIQAHGFDPLTSFRKEKKQDNE
jgi:hypothetical protein